MNSWTRIAFAAITVCFAQTGCKTVQEGSSRDTRVQSITIDPRNNSTFGSLDFAVTTLATGTLSIAPNKVSIDLASISLKASPTYDRTQRVETMAICISNGVYGGRWSHVKCSSVLSVKKSIPSGQTVTIAPHKFEIDVRDVKSLKRAWITAELKRVEGGDEISYYTRGPNGQFAE